MKPLHLGAGFCGIGLVCMLLVGGVGPCGPSGPFGATFLLAGLFFGSVGWLASVVDAIKLAIRGQRDAIAHAAVIALLPSLIIPATMGLVMDEPLMAVYAVWFWPPLT